MDDYYIADDGTIHNRNQENRTRTNQHTTRNGVRVGRGRMIGFWIGAMFMALGIGSSVASILIEMGIAIEESILTVGLGAGAMISSGLYIYMRADRHYYNLTAFLWAMFWAVIGTFAALILGLILPTLLTILSYLLMFIVIIGILAMFA